MQFSAMFESYNFWWQKILSLQPTQNYFQFLSRKWKNFFLEEDAPPIIINPRLGRCHHIRVGHVGVSTPAQTKQGKKLLTQAVDMVASSFAQNTNPNNGSKHKDGKFVLIQMLIFLCYSNCQYSTFAQNTMSVVKLVRQHCRPPNHESETRTQRTLIVRWAGLSKISECRLSRAKMCEE